MTDNELIRPFIPPLSDSPTATDAIFILDGLAASVLPYCEIVFTRIYRHRRFCNCIVNNRAKCVPIYRSFRSWKDLATSTLQKHLIILYWMCLSKGSRKQRNGIRRGKELLACRRKIIGKYISFFKEVYSKILF